MKRGCRSAPAASSRNFSSPASSTGGSAQPRGLETNTWMVSQPICKPAALLKKADGEADDGAARDAAARLGVLVGDHAAEPEGVVPAEPARPQGLLGLGL